MAKLRNTFQSIRAFLYRNYTFLAELQTESNGVLMPYVSFFAIGFVVEKDIEANENAGSVRIVLS